MRQTDWLMVLVLAVGPISPVRADDEIPRQKTSVANATSFARPEELRVLQSLSRRITLEINEIALDQAVEQISQLIGLDILINDSALGEEAVSKESAVSLNLGEITAWQALHFLLKPLNLVWVINDGVLEITTATDAETGCITRIHDVKQLCQLLTPITNEKFLQNRRAKPDDPGMKAGRPAKVGRAMFSVPTDANAKPAIVQPEGGVSDDKIALTTLTPKIAELLLSHMISDLSSLNWEERDGFGGTIALGDGALIVTQTFQGQLEVAGMLQALELLAAGNASGHSMSAQKPGYPVDEDGKVTSLLAKPRTLQIDEGPLSSVLGKIAQDVGFRLWIDQARLSEEGKNLELLTCSTRRFRELPLGVCLKKILEQHGLTFVVEEGAIVISTFSNAEQSVSVQFFDMGPSSKISGIEQLDGIKNILRGASRTTLEDEWDDEIAFASFISTRHFVVRQTQQANERIALFVDDLVSRSLPFPIDPIHFEFEFRVYTAPDIATATDLEQVLPQLLETYWYPSGSIRRANSSLVIKQPPPVHDRIEEIMAKLEESHAVRNPPVPVPIVDQADEDEAPKSVDDRVD